MNTSVLAKELTAAAEEGVLVELLALLIGVVVIPHSPFSIHAWVVSSGWRCCCWPWGCPPEWRPEPGFESGWWLPFPFISAEACAVIPAWGMAASA